MNLGERNKQYWQNYAPGTTPGIEEVPDVEALERLKPGARILDIGTGTGNLAEMLAGRGFEVYGVDINPQEIAANQQRKTAVKYSVADITQRTEFDDNFFDLILFRYTLTNIHKEQWPGLRAEVSRLATQNGLLWLAEPLVNEGYQERYALAAQKMNDAHGVYVFKDKERAKQIKTVEDLDAAESNDEIARIVRHYTPEEVQEIFKDFHVLSSEQTNHTSPSGYALPTLVMLLAK